jgi:ATP synthase protein I
MTSRSRLSTRAVDKWRASIEKKTRRKLLAQQQKKRSIWFGLGMFGLVGWSVVVPMLIGIALGVWIDQHWPSRVSWTITLLFAGVVLGCIQAWQWIKRESQHD